MSLNCPLVWVHLGSGPIPKFLLVSIKNLIKIFPDQEFILLVDRNTKVPKLLSGLEIKRVAVLDEKWINIKSSLQHDLNFRNEFWFNSLARFRAIYDFMEKENVNSLIHIESDVTLLPNFPFKQIIGLKEKLSYSIQGSGQGIASVLYVGSQTVLNKFLRFCEQEVESNPSSTDMSILYNFAIAFPENVEILPTLPDVDLNRNKKYEIVQSPATNLSKFNGAFDAISIGQYLFGIDPRNNRGIKILFRQDETHWVKPNQYEYKWAGNALMAISDKSAIEIFTLHIHSKDINAFEFNKLKPYLELRVSQMSQGEIRKFELLELRRAIQRSIIRRMKKYFSK